MDGVTVAPVGAAVTDVTDEVVADEFFCYLGKHTMPAKYRRPDRTHPQRACCRSCNNIYASAKPAGRDPVYLQGDALLADNEQRYLRWLSKPDGKVASRLGFKRKSVLQTDLSIECDKVGADPGSMNQSAVIVTADEVAARRQEKFEASEAAPRAPRQQRRARERRLVKDVRAASRRLMSDAEATAAAITACLGARRRAKGGVRTTKRRVKAVEWKLDPKLVHEMMVGQGHKCALTGEPFQASVGHGTTNPYEPSPNRIDPGGPYIIENCEIVCWWVNRLINDMPRSLAIEFLADRKLLRRGVGQMSLI